MKLKSGFKLIVFLASLLQQVCGREVYAEQIIHIAKPEYNQDEVIIPLLKLALEKSGLKATFKEVDANRSANRKLKYTLNGKIDVLWFGASHAKGSKLQPVRIPILKGLQGYRVLVIREEEQLRYDYIRTAHDLKDFVGGLGRDWGGVPVFQQVNAPLVLPVEDRHLWSMMNARHFDYVPLAIYEPWPILKNFKKNKYPFAVEDGLLFVYPHAVYFFVHPDNKELANQIRLGMEIAIRDGSYDKLLFSSEYFQTALKIGRITERRIIQLPNPSLPSNIPVHIQRYWIDIEQLKNYKTSK